MTPDDAAKHVIAAMGLCRQRIEDIDYDQQKSTTILAQELEHERFCLEILARLATGGITPEPGTAVWERIKRPQV